MKRDERSLTSFQFAINDVEGTSHRGNVYLQHYTKQEDAGHEGVFLSRRVRCKIDTHTHTHAHP